MKFTNTSRPILALLITFSVVSTLFYVLYPLFMQGKENVHPRNQSKNTYRTSGSIERERNEEASVRAAKLAIGRGDYAVGVRLLEQVLDSSSAPHVLYLELAEARLNMGGRSRASMALVQYLEPSQPSFGATNSPEVYHRLLVVADRIADENLCFRSYQKSCAECTWNGSSNQLPNHISEVELPLKAKALASIAMQYQIVGSAKDGIQLLRQALNLAPNSVALNFEIGYLARLDGQWEPATKHLKRAWEAWNGVAGTKKLLRARYLEACHAKNNYLRD